MSIEPAENKAVEIMRSLATKIRRELLSPELNIRNLCAQVEQTAGLVRAELDAVKPEVTHA